VVVLVGRKPADVPTWWVVVVMMTATETSDDPGGGKEEVFHSLSCSCSGSCDGDGGAWHRK
jgi:hypothetical protein